MPQNTVLPGYKAEYPILAPAQKPGGVTVSTTLPATAVPNKSGHWTGFMMAVPGEIVEEEQAPAEESSEEETEDEEEEDK